MSKVSSPLDPALKETYVNKPRPTAHIFIHKYYCADNHAFTIGEPGMMHRYMREIPLPPAGGFGMTRCS
jgi:hypothetical protein